MTDAERRTEFLRRKASFGSEPTELTLRQLLK